METRYTEVYHQSKYCTLQKRTVLY